MDSAVPELKQTKKRFEKSELTNQRHFVLALSTFPSVWFEPLYFGGLPKENGKFVTTVLTFWDPSELSIFCDQ